MKYLLILTTIIFIMTSCKKKSNDPITTTLSVNYREWIPIKYHDTILYVIGNSLLKFIVSDTIEVRQTLRKTNIGESIIGDSIAFNLICSSSNLKIIYSIKSMPSPINNQLEVNLIQNSYYNNTDVGLRINLPDTAGTSKQNGYWYKFYNTFLSNNNTYNAVFYYSLDIYDTRPAFFYNKTYGIIQLNLVGIMGQYYLKR